MDLKDETCEAIARLCGIDEKLVSEAIGEGYTYEQVNMLIVLAGRVIAQRYLDEEDLQRDDT